ncbi:MAG: bifunctional hydroxymethylpyrimidine kinase/phosphomethylpyrimidine kinase [Solidesulfovibrio sp.]|uniref:bifunctional hydroxymethylpyrimidine kinase/phosphomethylpyrimidine kinase n=1 Tax=Solidesulfovibrio sp. TaxID=2910990 RepID=UPI002B213969|nr:bifunctional hydroxymethylpyrimidine kinase/phosphomethylpyrimidine kinase [Solidesulfovibrio sp.]MEA4857884.1 bifunctional hydroxymethylpyrimidine kinase/phosphomethylpyrimidine kinase [Solidesulfovibrio sp.]
MLPPCVLTVAGSDSGGGAGIQADLKTFMMQGCYGLSAITALTAQNTRAVTAIEAPTPGFVAEQLRAVLADFPIKAAKTGMLFSAPIIEAVADALGTRDFPLVVDPVCVAQSGARLLLPEAMEALVVRMLPLADLLTPNRLEAEALAGMAVTTRADAGEAASRLLALGAKAVLLKGGHFADGAGGSAATITDLLVTADGISLEYVRPRLATKNAHGTGCTLSAAIAAHLALGKGLAEAVAAGRDYLQLALETAWPLGGGDGPVNHLAPYQQALERLRGREGASSGAAFLEGKAFP